MAWLALADRSAISIRSPGAEPARPDPPKPGRSRSSSREVPRWSRENHCFSCHNNGDAARALYDAVRGAMPWPADALADTTGWLARPDGLGPQRRRRAVQRQAAGPRASSPRPWPPRVGPAGSPIAQALRRAADGSSATRRPTAPGRSRARIEPGSPAAYGRSLATSSPATALAPPTRTGSADRHRAGRRLAPRPRGRDRHRRLGRCSWPRRSDRSPAGRDAARPEPRPAPRGPVRRRRLGAVRHVAPRALRHGPGPARLATSARFARTRAA